MSAASAVPLRTGRLLTLTAIVLLALNLRTAVAPLAPVFDEISQDIPLTSVGIGLLGTLPPISFAVFGLLAPAIGRRIGLDTAILVSACVMAAGHLLRSVAPDYTVLFAGSIVTLAGVGVGNVLLPPVVKRYFPERIGTLTALSSALLAVSASVPPLLSAPLAATAGWRFDLAVWGFVSLTAVAPWVGMWLRERRARSAAALGNDQEVEEVPALGRIWRSPVAWATATVFASSAFNAYAMFAWLPEILTDTAGADAFTAGALLGLHSIAGLPVGVLVPLLAVRMRNPSRAAGPCRCCCVSRSGWSGSRPRSC